LSCNSTYVSRHADSVGHRNNIKKTLLLQNNDDISQKICKTFHPKWLEIEQYKCWLLEVPHDTSLFFCLICNVYRTIGGGLSHIEHHAKSEKHLNKCKNFIEISKSNEQSNMQTNELLMHSRSIKKKRN